MFTAIAILKLRDEGRLRLDDPVRAHLPWFKDRNNDHSDAIPITIRHLLTHTAGLPNEAPGADTVNHFWPSLEEIITRVPDTPVAFAPESRWKYSNFGAVFSGTIISSVTGMSYESYVRKILLNPLGMTSTDFTIPDEMRSRMATGYGQRLPDGGRARRPAIELKELKAVSPAGGLWSSVNDLARFASWQFRVLGDNDFEVLDQRTLREMQRVHWIDKSWEFGFGLGFIVYHKEPEDLVGHGGSGPGFHTDFTVSPAEKLGVIVLANGDGIRVYPDQAQSVSDRVFTWIIPAIRNVLNTTTEPAGFDPSFSKYLGKYRSAYDDDQQVLFVNGSLVLIDPRNPPALADMPRLVHVKENVFRLETEDGFNIAGEQFVFEENQSGEIIRLRVPGYSYEKIRAW
jgi:CubicO group peptidase (beta-lactamase class C family)